jgi:hypothetical protein
MPRGASECSGSEFEKKHTKYQKKNYFEGFTVYSRLKGDRKDGVCQKFNHISLRCLKRQNCG